MIDLDELERLEAAATKGPWTVCHDECSITCDVDGPGITLSEYAEEAHYDEVGKNGCCGYPPDPFLNCDAAFIVALRNAAPSLIRELREAREEIEELQAQVRNLETIGAPIAQEFAAHSSGLFRERAIAFLETAGHETPALVGGAKMPCEAEIARLRAEVERLGWILKDTEAEENRLESEVARLKKVEEAINKWLDRLDEGGRYRDGIPGELFDALEGK
jgi:hypothetical protein